LAQFKVGIKDGGVFARIEKSIIKDVELILSSKEMMNEVGEFVAERVRYQARVSKPLNAQSSLPKLKTSSISSRKYIAKHNQTHQTFEPSRSNLTITGQLLDSITHKIIGVGQILIDVAGKHRGYKSGTGAKGKDIENKDLKEYLIQKGFVIFDKTIETNTLIQSRIKTIVLRYIRRGLAIRNRLAKK
jgi:hypothetical protein